MDHHCIFISACIGFFNYKYFLLFILYALIGSSAIVYDCYTSDVLYSFKAGFSLRAFLLIVTFTVCGSLVLTLAMFLALHIRMAIINGYTQVEWNEKDEKRRHYIGDAKYKHPYKLATSFQQFKHIFGFSIWQWLLPVPIYSGKKIRTTMIVQTPTSSPVASPLASSSSSTSSSSSGPSILRTVGRLDNFDELGADVELDELSAVPLLSSFTLGGTPISAPTKGLEATRELAVWEMTHQIDQEHSQFERSQPHPIYDHHIASLYTRSARLKKAAEGVLGRAEESLVAEWTSKGLMFPIGPTIVHSQLMLWRESKLFKQA